MYPMLRVAIVVACLGRNVRLVVKGAINLQELHVGTK